MNRAVYGLFSFFILISQSAIALNEPASCGIEVLSECFELPWPSNVQVIHAKGATELEEDYTFIYAYRAKRKLLNKSSGSVVYQDIVQTETLKATALNNLRIDTQALALRKVYPQIEALYKTLSVKSCQRR